MGVQAAGNSGSLADMQAASEKLKFLRLLHEKLRYDPYLLATPVERISSNVQEERRRRLVLSIGAAILSTAAGWLLSAVNPSSLPGIFHGVYGALASLLPWLPH